MALTDTAVKNFKSDGSPLGKKHSDGLGLYLHVKEAGKYWRMNYRFASCSFSRRYSDQIRGGKREGSGK